MTRHRKLRPRKRRPDADRQLTESAKKLATAFGPGMIESFDKTVARMGDIVKTMKEAQALQKRSPKKTRRTRKGQRPYR